MSVTPLANSEEAFGVGFDKTWTSALTGRMSANETFAFQLLDNGDLRAALLEESRPDIYRRARVARQRTCPIGELIRPDGESRYLEHADALAHLLHDGTVALTTEVIVHVRDDGTTLDDGTALPMSVVERIAPEAFIRALIHDADNRPINASAKRRHITTRQKRVVEERDRTCVDCGATMLLELDQRPRLRNDRPHRDR